MGRPFVVVVVVVVWLFLFLFVVSLSFQFPCGQTARNAQTETLSSQATNTKH